MTTKAEKAVFFRREAAIAPMPGERSKAPDAPRAVCLAALKALEGKDDQPI